MRDIQVVYHPDDIHQHFYRKWHTDLFRSEHDKSDSYIHRVMERLARYPLFTYTLSDHPRADIPINQKTEWRHLSAWWGGFQDCKIDGALNDTRWLHEIAHRIYMVYLPDISFAGFQQKMQHNELRATMASMFEVYFHYPELRDLTFAEEILADRFLEDKNFMQTWKEDSHTKSEQIFLMLCDAARYPHPSAPLEHFFYDYNKQAERWAGIWSNRYQSIESAMDKLQNDIQCGIDRKEVMDVFMHWLQSEPITHGTEIPFVGEATAYAAVYLGDNI